MAFISKVGNLLKQGVSKQLSSGGVSASNPSLFQAIRCMTSSNPPSSKVFVGGLSYNTDETSLREAFAPFGEVIEARVIMDRETGRSRGFGFVSFTSTDEADNAIQNLDQKELEGRIVRVNYATDRSQGGFRSGGSGGYGGGGYGGGGYGGGGYSGGGGGYSGGSGYGGGNNYGSSGGGGYAAGTGNYNSGGYGSGSASGYDGGNGGSFGGDTGGNFSVAGGAGGSDNLASGGGSFATGGYGETTGLPYNGSSTQYTGEVGGATASGGYGQVESLDGDFKDDIDASEDFAEKRS